MENQQQSLQTQPTFNLSPAIVAFLVLAGLVVLTALYVVNRDIETEGPTVLESTVPLRFESGEARLSGRYPDGWRYEEVDNTVVFTPRNARTDDPTTIILAHVEEEVSPEEYARRIEANALAVIDETDSYDALPDGVMVTVREADELEARHIIFSDGEGGLFVATLRTEDVDEYARELEFMAQTLDFLRPLPLTQRAERPQFSIAYPEGFSDDPQDDSAVFFTETDDAIDNSESIIIQMIVASPLELLGPDMANASPTEITSFIGDQLTGSTPETSAFDVTLGDYSGARMVLASNSNPDVVVELTTLDLTDGNILLILARSTRDDYPKLTVTIEAMVESFEYAGSSSDDVEATNDADQEEDEASSEENVSEEGTEAEPTPESTQTHSEEDGAHSQE